MDRLDKHFKYHDVRNVDVKNELVAGEFIVTEKIHGSNFSIGYIKNSLRIQSRNRILDENSKEFGFDEIKTPLIQTVEKLKDVIKYNFLIFGEIFGKTIPAMNYYDHVSADLFGSKAVFFRAFDLYNVDENTFIKYSDAIELFVKVGLPYVPILNINYRTTGDLRLIVEKYESAFSKKYVEGFVLKKDENELSCSRNIFKLKRKEFCGNNVQLLNKHSIKSYVNYNRFISAYSKIGDDLEKIKEEMIRDSLKDMMTVISDEVKKEVEENCEKFQNKFKKYQEKKLKEVHLQMCN